MPAVAEGHVRPVETNYDVQQAPHEGMEGREEVAGDGVWPMIKATGRPQ